MCAEVDTVVSRKEKESEINGERETMGSKHQNRLDQGWEGRNKNERKRREGGRMNYRNCRRKGEVGVVRVERRK